MQHNEVLDTWLPLEYELNQTWMAFLKSPLPPGGPAGAGPTGYPGQAGNNLADADASAGFRAIPLRRLLARQQLAQFPHRALQQPGPLAAPPRRPPDCHTGSGG